MTAIAEPAVLPLADTPLGRTVALGPTDIWNDSCAVDDIEYALSYGAVGATANPTIVVDVWKCTYSQFDAGGTHPVSGDKITASAPPTISSATKSQDSTLTGWTTAFAAGDILAFNVNSATTKTRLMPFAPSRRIECRAPDRTPSSTSECEQGLLMPAYMM